MFRASRSYGFEASHQLPRHGGKCARLHGHSYRVTVVAEGSTLHHEGSSTDMLVDFGDIDRIVKPIIDELDHRHLNDVTGLANPTSEALARWLYERVGHAIRYYAGIGEAGAWPPDVALLSVTVSETDRSSATYEPLRPEQEP